MSKETNHTQDYIKELNDKYKQGNAREHAYRGILETLITRIVSNVSVMNEPSGEKCGNPDYVISRESIPVGYIEAKDIGKDLNNKAYKEQFDRYKNALDNLIITDYMYFQFYVSGALVKEIRIGELRDGKIFPIKDNLEEFEGLIVSFCGYQGVTIKSPERLAELMASKAKMLQSVIDKAISPKDATDSIALGGGSDTSSEERTNDTSLHEQYEVFKSILIHDLTYKDFADIYSQTLAYGMFAARLHDPSLDTFSRREAVELIPQSNPFLRQLFQSVAGYNIDPRIMVAVDNLAELFRATDIKELLKGFGSSTQASDPIIHFYETFLTKFDPANRKSRGVWYTPEPVVKFIVKAVDDILIEDFGLRDGLADTSKTTIKIMVKGRDGKEVLKDREVHRVQILDPATGTGTFLAEVIKYIYGSRFKSMQGVWADYVEKDLIPRLNGFELLMASYAMAHLKLDMLLRETGYTRASDSQRFNIYLTNTLEEHHPDTSTLFASWLSGEANQANRIKRDAPVMVVMGNPPYSGESSNKSDWIMNLMEDYKKEPGGIIKLQERNPKWINDDYAKFIRFGEYFVAKNNEGILAYINNHNFLDNITFRGMRWHLLNTFDKIYIIDLHGNSDKKERCSDGSKDENVFDIKMGVSINVFVKTGKKKKGALAEVYHADLWGKREIKYKTLISNTLNSLPFKKVNYSTPLYLFSPKDEKYKKKYDKGFSITELMTTNSVGFVSSNDNLNISFTKNEQAKKINDFLTLDELAWREKYDRDKDSRDWRYLFAKEDAIRNVNMKLTQVSYRPFDNRYTLYTAQSRGLYSYPRYEVMRHFIEGENVGLISTRFQFRKNNNYAHVSISKNIVDINYIQSPGIINVFPLYLYPESGSELNFDTTTSRKPNLNPEIVAQISKALSLRFTPEKEDEKGTFAPIDLLDYIYAVLHSPSYREKYKEFLKTDFPRIPYPADTTLFWKLVKLGGTIRLLHLLDENLPVFNNNNNNNNNNSSNNNHSNTTTTTNPSDFATYPKTGDNIITKKMTTASAGFIPHHIDTDTDTVIDTDTASNTATTNNTTEENEVMGNVWINDTQHFGNIPLVAWNFSIGGYQPAQKWLKDRHGRTLSFDDIQHYRKIIISLYETHQTMMEIDTLNIC